jgi:hypothetical protein
MLLAKLRELGFSWSWKNRSRFEAQFSIVVGAPELVLCISLPGLHVSKDGKAGNIQKLALEVHISPI